MTGIAAGDVERRQILGFEPGIAVGCDAGAPVSESGVVPQQSILGVFSRITSVAVHAAHLVYAAVKFDDVLLSRFLMQTIHVLCDQSGNQSMLLQDGQAPVRGVGPGGMDSWPADHAPGPVALAGWVTA